MGWGTSGTVSPREYQREQRRKASQDAGEGFVTRNRFRILVCVAALVAITGYLIFLFGFNPPPLIPTLSPPSPAAIASESTACKADIASLRTLTKENPLSSAFAAIGGPNGITEQAEALDKAVDRACPVSVATWVDDKVYLAWLEPGRIGPRYSGAK